MFAPGGIALAIAVLLLFVIKDDPETAGIQLSVYSTLDLLCRFVSTPLPFVY